MLTLAVAAAVVLAGSVAWKAEALTFNSATVNLPGVVKTCSPIEKTGCYRRGGGSADWNSGGCRAEGTLTCGCRRRAKN